jgi:hypothetical protein
MSQILVRGHVVDFPALGRLFVCSDIQGNLADFVREVELFEARQQARGDAYLLFLGDLIHGMIHYTRETWPEWVGPHFDDESPAVLEALVGLQERWPGGVCSLLGNHEHAHIGGAVLEAKVAHFNAGQTSDCQASNAFSNRYRFSLPHPVVSSFAMVAPTLKAIIRWKRSPGLPTRVTSHIGH